MSERASLFPGGPGCENATPDGPCCGQLVPAPPVEVKYERDFNYATGDEVLRIFARYRGSRRWSKFVAVASKNQPILSLVENAQYLGETWLRLETP